MDINSIIIAEFLVGIVMGGATVGSSINRTIAVYEGDARNAIAWNVLNGVSYFIGIYFIVQENYIGFVGTIIGSCIAVLRSSIKYRRKREG